MKIETKFDLFQRVLIRDLEKCPAVVMGIGVGQYGTTFNVRWFHDGKINDCWLTEYELSAARDGGEETG